MKTLLRKLPIVLGSLGLLATPAWAQQGGGGVTDVTFKYISAAFGMAIAAAAAAYADSRAISAACEGVARNPGAGGRLQTLMLIGVVFIETLVLFTLAVIFLKVA